MGRRGSVKKADIFRADEGRGGGLGAGKSCWLVGMHPPPPLGGLNESNG